MSGLNPKQIMDYDYGTYKGYMAENFVAQEIKVMGEIALLLLAGKNIGSRISS